MTTTTKAPALKERDIERTCGDFLALDGWRCLKTDPVSRREWGKGFGEKGMADCLYLRYIVGSQDWLRRCWEGIIPLISQCVEGEIMWIEWKSPRGKLAAHQRRWHNAERARGALTLIAGEDFPATIEGFMKFYRRSGLLRRVGL